MRKISLLRSYIILLLIIKMFFVFLLLNSFIIKHLLKQSPNNKTYQKSLEVNNRIKSQIEFIFNIAMALLMIIVFNPRQEKHLKIDSETRLLFYLFGYLLIISADWGSFIHF